MPSDSNLNRIARLFEREHALLSGRATSALYLLLKAQGFEQADILVPNNICYSVPLAILRSGNRPVFCDISLQHYGVTPETLGRALTPRTKAAIVAHMYGHTGDWDAAARWCREHELYLIEDAALAVGGKHEGRKVGSLGDSALLSFSYGKVIDRGAGGLLLTDDRELYREATRIEQSLPPFNTDLLAQMNEFGQIYRHLRPLEALRPRIHNVYAALFELYVDSYFFQADPHWSGMIWSELQSLDRMRAERQERAALYDEHLQSAPLVKLAFPRESMIWRYTFRCLQGRDLLLERLRAAGIPASSWYPPVDRMFHERETGGVCAYPSSDVAGAEVINLWVDDSVSREELLRTTDVINRWLNDEAALFQMGAVKR